MAPQAKCSYEFGPFRIDTAERLLFAGSEVIPLAPMAVSTLLVLLANAGRVVRKEELIRLVWPDTTVEEGGLARNISVLRKAFEEQAPGVPFIETIAKNGYRFIAPVETPQTAESPTPADAPTPADVPPAVRSKKRRKTLWLAAATVLTSVLLMGYSSFSRFWRTPAASRRIGSLMVLPLESPSNDPEQDAFADGATEELINSLSTIEALRVISQTTAMTYKHSKKALNQIAAERGADAVVEGSVFASGGQVRITIQVVEAQTEKSLLAKEYKGDRRDLMVLESAVAKDVAREIQAKWTDSGKSKQFDADAWLTYQYGRGQWNKRTGAGVRNAIEYYNKAIQMNPSFAPAYAGLADAWALFSSAGTDAAPPKDSMPQARTAALKAVELDGSMAEGHASLAYIYLSYDWDLEAANREFVRAIELNPGYATAHHWYAHYWLARHDVEKALEEERKALLLDPLSPIINTSVAWFLYHARRYDEAIAAYRRTLDLDEEFSVAHCALGMALSQKQEYAQAIREFDRALELGGNTAFALAGKAGTYGMSGRRAEGMAELGRLQDFAKNAYVPAVYFVAAYAALGDREHAIAALEKAFEERSEYLLYVGTDAWAGSLHDDPRFQKLLQKTLQKMEKARQ